MNAINPIGQLIDGRYEIQAVLAPGGQGDVYQVLDHHEHDVYVLKLLHAPGPVPANVWAEAQILRHLRDDHILEIRNAAVVLGRPYIVTAFARYGTLETALAATGGVGLPMPDVVTWMRQAAMGVARAHDAALVHNDLKPANLFLNENRDCLVGDFGGASLIPAGHATTAPRAATPETVAPEVAATWGTTAPVASFASDVYSLGATAYWLLAGGSPIDLGAVPPHAKMSTVATATPARLRDVAPHVPLGVAAIIERAMAPNPADRYPTVSEFAGALGGRAAVPRTWFRTNEHAGHIGCWRGERSGASTYVLCVESVATRCSVTARHLKSNARVSGGTRSCKVKAWPQAVRAVIRSVG